MALENVPWYVGGGAIHSAAVARNVYYEATGGTNGIGGATDFKVTQTPTASGSVRIAPGAGTMRSRYPGAFRESYACRGASVTDVPIPATDSVAGRTDYLILRVDDPGFPGQLVPASVENGPYVRPVLISTDPGLHGEKLSYPNIPLAKIVQPINNATITNAMITDLRRVAQPKSFGRMLSIFPTGSRAGGHPMPVGGYSSWPITAEQRPTLDVPPWATHLELSAQYSGIWFDGGGAPADSVAGVRFGFGVLGSENGILVENKAASRNHYSVIGRYAITDEQRGTKQLLNLQGNRTGGTGMWYADYQSAIGLDYEFTEQAL